MSYDNNPIIVITEYSHSMIKKYWKFNLKNYRILSLVVLSFFIIQDLFGFFGFWDGFAKGPSLMNLNLIIRDYNNIFYFIVPILFFLWTNGTFYTEKKYIKQYDASYELKYVFNETHFEILNQDKEIFYKAPYTVLKSIHENPDVFYLYLNTKKQNGYIMSKHGFQSGTPEELSELLKCKTKNCYYQIYKK